MVLKSCPYSCCLIVKLHVSEKGGPLLTGNIDFLILITQYKAIQHIEDMEVQLEDEQCSRQLIKRKANTQNDNLRKTWKDLLNFKGKHCTDNRFL